MLATPRLDLPLLAANQAQKHVTHNEALVALDALIQLSVLDRTHAEPPPASAEGDRHIVASTAMGAWSGRSGMIAVMQDGAWRFLAPRQGWLAYVGAENIFLAFDGASWSDIRISRADRIGVNASPDNSHRLVVASDGALFTAASQDHRVTVNKAEATATASIVLQSGWSGRAELGLAGSNDLAIKVSADGLLWRQALTVDADTGCVGLGVASPAAPLTIDSSANPLEAGSGSLMIQGEANKELIEIRSVGAAPGAGVQGFGARGALSDPQTLQNGNRLVALLGSGFDGTQYVTPAPVRIEMVADGAWSTSARGAAIVFRTTPSGATVDAERMRITGAGKIGVGTANPTATLDVAGHVRVGQFTKTTLPAAASIGAGAIIYVSNDAGGAVLAFSDGSTWRRVTDRAAVS